MAPITESVGIPTADTEERQTLESKLDRIRLHKTSKLANQSQLAVILNAVEETLKEQETELTASAYVIALLSLVGQAFSGSDITNPELASSAVYLLDIVLPYAPSSLLISKFSSILSLLSPALTHADSTSALIRSAIGALETILAAQDSSSWLISVNESGPRMALSGLLSLSLDERPKVRKRAQEAVTAVLSAVPAGPSPVHPALATSADISLNSAKELYTAYSSKGNRKNREEQAKQPGAGAGEKKIIFALQLVRSIANNENGWPVGKIQALCEILFTISRSAEEFLVMTSLEVFQSVFTGVAGGRDDEKIESAKFTKIVDSVLDLRPAVTDSQLGPSWLAIVAQCFSAYTEVDEQKAFSRLPKLYETIVEYLGSGLPNNVVVSAAQCLVALSATCIRPERLVAVPLAKSTKKVLQEISQIVLSLLSVKYQSSWKEAFSVLVALFDALDYVADPYLIDAIVSVGELRTGEAFEGRAEADEVLAAAIRALGPEKILELLPLNLEKPGPKSPGRAFLLPLLRDNIRYTNLNHYVTKMVPLSERLFQKVVDFGAQEKTMEIKIYETLVEQIWSLLPRYCDLPFDLRQSFSQKFAELLANVLYQKVDLRQIVCRSLRILVESTKTYVEGSIDGSDPFLEAKLSKKEAQKNLEYLSTLASKFLAVLFNVFSQTVTEHRHYVLDSINAFLSITSKEDLVGTFHKVTGLLNSSLQETQDKKKEGGQQGKNLISPMSHTMADLVVTMVPYLPKELYGELSNIFITAIKHFDPQVQKRGYRIVSRLADIEDGRDYMLANMNTLEVALLESAEKITPPSRGSRLTSLIDVVNILPSSDLHFIPTILPEAVIGTKEVNEKTREAAYQLLVQMGDKMAGGGSVAISKVPDMDKDAADVEASIDEYFTMVSAGLAGAGPHMISATITALSRLLYQYKSILEPNVVEELVATIDLFLTSKNREIVKSALGFVKVMVTSLPKEVVEPRLKTLVPNLLEWAHEHHARFKLKVKHLIERLVRRFSVETIEKVFPEADKKLLTNIRKSKERARRKQEAAGLAGDGDEDGKRTSHKKKYLSEFEEAIYGSSSDEEEYVEDEQEDKQKKKQQKGRFKKQNEMYIIDGKDKDPLDLLDNKALARISSTKPVTQNKAKNRQSKVKVDEDGKMIVDDEESGKKAIPDAESDEAMIKQLAEQAAEANPTNAYVEALKNGPVRGQRNKLKFKNKRSRDDDSDDESGPQRKTNNRPSQPPSRPPPRRRARF
ncbi:NUC173 domain-containing protein [Lipomyces japonicus]|uniref:NUC173 domain-containing protein n=1 Tax=Lipomyces japonicus TaxID=56871 RepID=UPI0034CDCE93